MGLLIFMAGFVAYFVIRYRANISKTFQDFEEFQKSRGSIALPGKPLEDNADLEFNLDVWVDDEKRAS